VGWWAGLLKASNSEVCLVAEKGAGISGSQSGLDN
jgi:hypothetical protein